MSKNDLPDEIKALQAGIKLGLAAFPKPEPEIRSGSLFNTGIRPAIDAYLEEKSKEIRDYGDYWSASSAGYCHRKLIFERLGVPPVSKDSDARRTRVFEAGHLFHSWIQGVTKGAGLSVGQEVELRDEDIMVRGHIDDLILINGKLILYDYKTQHSNAFTWQKGRPASYFHRMQVGTYMYMLRKYNGAGDVNLRPHRQLLKELSESRILKISKDDLRMDENQILWDAQLEKDVVSYWNTLNGYWKAQTIPKCTCDKFEGGFMSKEKFNPYFYEGEPCSIKLYEQFKLSKENHEETAVQAG